MTDPTLEYAVRRIREVLTDPVRRTHESRWDLIDGHIRELVGAMGPGCARIAQERARQVSAEGWSHEHDDEHDEGDLAQAAAFYACTMGEVSWPWGKEWCKPSTRIRDLEKAGALIAAEIDRLIRKGGHP